MEIIRVHEIKEAEILFLDALRYESSVVPSHLRIDAGIPGGRSAAPIIRAAARAPRSLLKRLHLYLIDERLEDPYNRDELLQLGLEDLIDSGALPRENFHVPSMQGGSSLPAYSSSGEMPGFSLMFAGVGEDGHVASLFPGSQALYSPLDMELIPDSPKPPKRRVTLTPHFFRKSRNTCQVYLLFFGPEKQQALQAFMTHDDPGICPATLFKGFTRLSVVTDLEV